MTISLAVDWVHFHEDRIGVRCSDRDRAPQPAGKRGSIEPR